jgi:hypothetical protein
MTSVWTSEKYYKTLFDLSQIDPSKGLDPAWFPGLFNLSSAFVWDFIYRPLDNRVPEFVYTPFEKCRSIENLSAEEEAIQSWNLTWETGHLRHMLFKNRLPPSLTWLSKFPESNLYLLPNTNKYETYCPLYHLLPAPSIHRFSLPIFGWGAWPVALRNTDSVFSKLTDDFEDSLSKAFAHHIWPLLAKPSMSFFSRNDPIVVLSHNLDFWLPYAYEVIENRLRGFPRCDLETQEQITTLMRLRRIAPPNIAVDLPLKGGDIWAGEADAWQAAQELVEVADRRGKLRAVIDAVLSNRIKDDFSHRWSHEREDFERKLYHKRSKFKVAFVELDDTIPVQGPSSEVEEDLLWEDFIALLNLKERQIVVCLRNGITKVAEIGQILGYANHSPVSKALQKIRAKAKQYLWHPGARRATKDLGWDRNLSLRKREN